ncbi:MAG: serine/threonine-protein kinase [Phycisphaeraceae bacterium]|nr:serine/threonine-protein kinase [Phycisphaeraceae bacterium]MBX3407624.1 serine/threonine-protein kinase [Phycisphaeraceae bacterium]
MSEPSTTTNAGLPPSIGPYRVERELGRGGMGVVYYARDPRLDRPVAIKVLPEAFAADPARLARFEREARTLAALNHQNVAAIYGLEEHDHRRVLILEFVPGATLSRLIERGPLPIDEAMRIGVQIAEGLEAAHDRAVVHRDLKPDNVKVTPEGLAKILDFGLATTSIPEDDALSRTRPAGLTQQGMVIGTPGYMSPEQARGLPTDKRTDIWAFGCVLFELITGHKAFHGETPTDSLAAVLDREPDWTVLPPVTPQRVRELLRKCLTKEPRRRCRDAGDARIDLEDALSQPLSGWYRAGGEGGDHGSGAPEKPRIVARLSLVLPPGREVANLARNAVAVSPDGAAVAYIAGASPDTHLMVRRMDDPEARVVPGTRGAESPTFSPDGGRIAFFADGRLKRVALSGGAPVPLAAAPRPQGACWAADECIYFVPDWARGLHRVHAATDNAQAERVADPDLAAGELAHIAPDVLPGGRHALIAAYGGAGRSASMDETSIMAIDLRTLLRKPLIHTGANPRYAPTGHLLFTRNGTLLAAPFDPDRLEVLGKPVEVQRGILGNALGGSAHVAFGAEGTLAFAPGRVVGVDHALVLASRAGGPVQPLPFRGPYVAPALAPAGPRRIVVQALGPTDQLWLIDLESGTSSQLTFHADNSCPVWSPDGTVLAFRSNMGGRAEIYRMPADGSGAPEQVFGSDLVPTPTSFSPDGTLLVFTQLRPAGGAEIWCVRIDDPASARPVVQLAASAWGGAISPDGRFLAFVSDQSGRPEVFVQPMAAAGAPNPQRWQVTGGAAGSAGGGAAPVWSRAGGELYYRNGDQVICSRFAVEPVFQLGKPRVVATGAFLSPTAHSANYDAAADGQSVLLVAQDEGDTPTRELGVVLNWFDHLRALAPVPGAAGRGTPSRAGTPVRRSFSSTAGTIA